MRFLPGIWRLLTLKKKTKENHPKIFSPTHSLKFSAIYFTLHCSYYFRKAAATADFVCIPPRPRTFFFVHQIKKKLSVLVEAAFIFLYTRIQFYEYITKTQKSWFQTHSKLLNFIYIYILKKNSFLWTLLLQTLF